MSTTTPQEHYQAYHKGASPAENTYTNDSNASQQVSPEETGDRTSFAPAPLFSSAPEPKSLGGSPVQTHNISPASTPGFPSPSPHHQQIPASPFIPSPISSPAPQRPHSQFEDAYQGIEVVPQSHSSSYPNEKMSAAQVQQPAPEYTTYPGGEKGIPSPQVQQVQMPQQQQQQQGQFPTAWPIRALQSNNAVVDCPVCGVRSVTTTTFIVGNTTNAWAAIICLVACLGCIPYLFTGTKDVDHKCGNCGVVLATWHRSGRTEVHVPQQVPIQQPQQQQHYQ
jgi:hypothetical protein